VLENYLKVQYMLNVTQVIMPITPRNGGAETYTAFSFIYFVVMVILVISMRPKKKIKAITN